MIDFLSQLHILPLSIVCLLLDLFRQLHITSFQYNVYNTSRTPRRYSANIFNNSSASSEFGLAIIGKADRSKRSFPRGNTLLDGHDRLKNKEYSLLLLRHHPL